MQMNTTENIVVGIAELGSEDPLIPLGIQLAESLGATLHLVHAFTLPEPIIQPYAELEWLSPARAEEFRVALATRLEEMTRGHEHRIPIKHHVLPGPSATVLTMVAEKVDPTLVVVGATRRGTLSRTILGTTAQRVLRASRAPTLIVREPFGSEVRRVLLTTDLSPLSAAVHRYGLNLVERVFGKHVEELRSLLVVGYDISAPPPLRTDIVRSAATAELQSFLAGCEAPSVPIEPAIRIGEPSNEIVAHAAEWPADLLVLGTHGRTGAQRFLLGSVAEATVRNALGSVLVIPAIALGLAADARGQAASHEGAPA
jgi:nucleotide-binding universal stress UspA family protein